MWLSRKEFNPSEGRFCGAFPALGAGFGEALQWSGLSGLSADGGNPVASDSPSGFTLTRK